MAVNNSIIFRDPDIIDFLQPIVPFQYLFLTSCWRPESRLRCANSAIPTFELRMRILSNMVLYVICDNRQLEQSKDSKRGKGLK